MRREGREEQYKSILRYRQKTKPGIPKIDTDLPSLYSLVKDKIHSQIINEKHTMIRALLLIRGLYP